MKKGIVGAIALASATLLVAMLALLLLSTPMALADGYSDNLSTQVDISGVAPSVGAITCDPDPLVPLAGANVTIRCYATITDNNGWGDIDQNGLNVTVWEDTAGQAGQDDLNDHYSNGTSSNWQTDCCWGDGCSGTSTGTTIVVSCNFTTRYFITSGATWNVNMSINDTSGLFGSALLDPYTVNSHLGLNVVNASLDFGSAALGDERNRTVNIENWCNAIIDINLAETDTTGDGVGYLDCALGSIDTDGANEGIRFNKTGTAVWAQMLTLAAPTGVDYNDWTQNYYDATGTQDGTEESTLHFTLRVPSSGISGLCNGTTRFTVKIDE
jgi:hypothetical protein